MKLSQIVGSNMPGHITITDLNMFITEFPQRTELILKLLQPHRLAVIKIHMVCAFNNVIAFILLDARSYRSSLIHLLPAWLPAQSVSAESGTLPPYGKHHR